MIYLDNAATTPMNGEVIERVQETMQKCFANSGTPYRIGLDAKRLIEKSAESIAGYLQIPSTHRLLFTSGGTESNNLFIKGLCFPDKKTAFLGLEHPSVTESLAFFKQFGNDPLSLLPFQVEGRLDLNSISTLNENRVKLLCLSHVNNELGTVNDPLQVASALEKESPQTKLFLDGVQAIGKIVLNPDMWKGLAGYSISGHKIHGPKGIGLLVYDSRLVLSPQMHGGKQQFGVRSGTLPLPLIMGLETAIQQAVERSEQNQKHLENLSRRLIQGLKCLQDQQSELNIRFNSLIDADATRQSPGMVNFSFSPVEGEVVLHHLEQKDIFVGMGSACSAQSKEPSKILMGLGLNEEQARCSLRISFSENNTLEDVDQFLEAFGVAYQTLYPTFLQKA
ncbi:MAG: cysteine desulfurase [Nitrospina sp.]|jgi:cysteine desulfurase|nr:cysteine desulfurase [Nitrospina sp.]MBT3874510.1 cysteine desulfurase [Nitrospina sp.]MBT4049887.1 cysteine desulfurase [Nitrospina sp.]MBT4557847.1 cysteine desulfurase [Nitrospina sp.]MBT5347979.1 cysteine desulfurase [Nitrospina sp.]